MNSIAVACAHAYICMGQSAALTQAAGSRGALWGRGTFPVSVWGAMAGPMDPLHDPAVLFRLLGPRFLG